MNKKELVHKLAKKTNITQSKALEIVNALFETEGEGGIIVTELDETHKVTIPGFGTFGVKTRSARVGVNPANKARLDIPSKTYAFFRAGKNLRERVEK